MFEPNVKVIYTRKTLGMAIVTLPSSGYLTRIKQVTYFFGEKLLFLTPRNKYAA